MNPLFERFLSQSRASTSIAELFSSYTHFMENIGFNRLAYVIISEQQELRPEHPLGLVQQENFNGWDQYYIDQGFHEVDPLFAETYWKPGIFVWKNFREQHSLSDKQELFFNEAIEVGQLYNGVTFSSHGPCGTKGVTIASSDSRIHSFSPLHIDSANLAAYQFHLCYLDLMQFQEHALQPLSHREQCVLQWAATGMTKSRIGEKMNISVHTVDYHMRNIMKKLHATNTTAALMTAVKNGMISP